MNGPYGGSRPNPLQYMAYCYGYTLPAAMRAWVSADLTGKGAARRTVVRFSVPAILLVAPFLLIPTTPYAHASMTLPILIPFVYFSIALNKVWRRHRLGMHGIDSGVIDERTRERDAGERRAYVERYGPRP
ncbi:DUF5313 domain-containing protein [Williamsia sp.]|uniref:DUF5313 domain-containing protein n=1 Tax=Williamsia sp. TaxID=1872085 RepID=UPI001A25E02F|nr:DUF5313 domain-containing protein [Williamsia sp.]MBJ7287937.1 DUF5313 domain-containing protein [Williamsia sp.]